MSKAAKPAKADKSEKGKQAIRGVQGVQVKPRSAFVDFMVFIGGVSSLIYVFNTIAPN